jgi:hypothetical protein
MSDYTGQFRQALEDGDSMMLWKMWQHAMPHLPQPKTLEQAEIIMHRARTEAETITLDKRAYSHAWLLERTLPSGLPDHLKAKAERLYPRIVEAVGIAVKMPLILKEVGLEIQKAMSDAVENAYADGNTDPDFIKERMAEARKLTLKRLLK